MYDIIELNVPMTQDEIEITKLALERYQETVVSVGETYTIEGLLEKLDK